MNPVTCLLVVAALLILLPCCIADRDEGCGIWLEFIFDHNMDYTDRFDPLVSTVDIFVFDNSGKFLFTKHAARTLDLAGGNRMRLVNGLKPGHYKIVTVGDLCGEFGFTDIDGHDPRRGETTFDRVKFAANNQERVMARELPDVWFGEAVAVKYADNNSVWLVPLVRNTNRFNLSLQAIDGNSNPGRAGEMPYTFEITAPEPGEYGPDNRPLTRSEIAYFPHFLDSGIEARTIIEARITTMRLFDGDPDGYRLIIRDIETGFEVWNYDLMLLLKYTKPSSRPDGTMLPMQEYLDRQSEWDIVVRCQPGIEPGELFIAVAIEINGWIIWLNEIDL